MRRNQVLKGAGLEVLGRPNTAGVRFQFSMREVSWVALSEKP